MSVGLIKMERNFQKLLRLLFLCVKDVQETCVPSLSSSAGQVQVSLHAAYLGTLPPEQFHHYRLTHSVLRTRVAESFRIKKLKWYQLSASKSWKPARLYMTHFHVKWLMNVNHLNTCSRKTLFLFPILSLFKFIIYLITNKRPTKDKVCVCVWSLL